MCWKARCSRNSSRRCGIRILHLVMTDSGKRKRAPKKKAEKEADKTTQKLVAFSDLSLRPELLKAVEEAGYTSPTPIQQQAIPLALEGRDLIGLAQTGTGKTASFTLPILERLLEEGYGHGSASAHRVRVLVLTPTRELCVQVEESFQKYGKHTSIRVAPVYGGVSIDPQSKQLRKGVAWTPDRSHGATERRIRRSRGAGAR